MTRLRNLFLACLCTAALISTGCSLDVNTDTPNDNDPPTAIISGGESARVTRIIDGDTIDVEINGVGYRVRYVGVNTPESDQPCYEAATNANAALVEGKTVMLVRDVNNTDQYGRLLRYVYVNGEFVNAELVAEGWAEAVEYPPDTAQADYFHSLEVNARIQRIGCHPSGVFNDNSDTR
ncbi:MAG: thermonuclease family protein [Anaerolinea sp.]|nr:thermonuclease family protein [Anaerolinea sp.]